MYEFLTNCCFFLLRTDFFINNVWPLAFDFWFSYMKNGNFSISRPYTLVSLTRVLKMVSLYSINICFIFYFNLWPFNKKVSSIQKHNLISNFIVVWIWLKRTQEVEIVSFRFFCDSFRNTYCLVCWVIWLSCWTREIN